MAVSVLRISLGRVSNLAGLNHGSMLHPLPKMVRCISSKAMRDTSVKKPAPWPYEKKKFTFWHGFLEDTRCRFDENTKILVVDGNLASGKSVFAEALAKELDMHFMPEPTMDKVYIDEYGFDRRTLDPKLPESCRSCDIKKFYQDPHNINVAKFQLQMYGLRLEQYIDALAHLLNTGQGVVLDRSVYSDFVFAETMFKFGYISRGVYNMYNEIKAITLSELLRPHLVIYLDVPVDTIMDRIKKRNVPHEVNSKVLTREYVQSIEDYYKHNFLKDINQHAELLIYDWSNYGDVEVVVEDIERIDFDHYDKHDLKLRDWNTLEEKWDWHTLRIQYTNEKDRLIDLMCIPKFDVPEILIPGEDLVEMKKVFDEVPSLQYAHGFNPLAGDTGLLFKSKANYRDLQKLRWTV